MRKYRVQIYQLFLSTLGIIGVIIVSMAPGSAKADRFVGQKWASNQQISVDQIRHDEFNTLLKRYVDADGYVDYKSWQASRADRGHLQNYLKQLSKANPKLSAGKPARLAYWINAYNAVTIEGILQVYPTSSIRNHTAKLVGYNIWKQLKLQVGDGQYSLEEIEHQVLRKMGEPRIHFAIVCASVGCPRLRNEAYTASHLESQLAENTQDFFSRSQHLQVDASRKTLKLSSLIDWFASDFGTTQSQQLQYLGRYMPKNAQQLIHDPKTKLSYLKYNWNLNDRSRK
ncbi:MAG: DUF547 domain-containing protein [Planctomycetaceae bacterium]|nr:DUF547 domain-containing protein [Planctomycetaceae bacterium]